MYGPSTSDSALARFTLLKDEGWLEKTKLAFSWLGGKTKGGTVGGFVGEEVIGFVWAVSVDGIANILDPCSEPWALVVTKVVLRIEAEGQLDSCLAHCLKACGEKRWGSMLIPPSSSQAEVPRRHVLKGSNALRFNEPTSTTIVILLSLLIPLVRMEGDDHSPLPGD